MKKKAAKVPNEAKIAKLVKELLVELGEEKEGVERLNGVIASLEGQRQTDETDACIIAIRRKILVHLPPLTVHLPLGHLHG